MGGRWRKNKSEWREKGGGRENGDVCGRRERRGIKRLERKKESVREERMKRGNVDIEENEREEWKKKNRGDEKGQGSEVLVIERGKKNRKCREYVSETKIYRERERERWGKKNRKSEKERKSGGERGRKIEKVKEERKREWERGKKNRKSQRREKERGGEREEK